MPESRATSLLTIGGLLVLAVVVSLAGSQIAGLDSQITKALARKVTPLMQTLETTVVQDSTGFSVKIITPRNEDETDAQHVARHKLLCQAAKDG